MLDESHRGSRISLTLEDACAVGSDVTDHMMAQQQRRYENGHQHGDDNQFRYTVHKTL